MRCHRCQRFGHKARLCRYQVDGVQTARCRRCGGNHQGPCDANVATVRIITSLLQRMEDIRFPRINVPVIILVRCFCVRRFVHVDLSIMGEHISMKNTFDMLQQNLGRNRNSLSQLLIYATSHSTIFDREFHQSQRIKTSQVQIIS